MNKYRISVAVILALVSGAALADLVGSKHDMTSNAPSANYNVEAGNTQVCVFCHTPHRSQNAAGLPLWNRNDSSVNAYTMYNSATLNGAMSTAPGGESLACLSCHDGTVAVNSLVNDPGDSDITQSNVFMADDFKVGTVTGNSNDLSAEHPIGVTYDPTADTGLNSIADAINATALELFGSSKVECATCHDVHNETPIDGGLAFLRVSATQSEICTDCHAK